jgi:transposase
MTWGCQVLDWQQPDIMKKTNNEPMSALTEQASEMNAQQGRKAKEIFLGIDAHVSRYLVARKLDGTAVQAAQSMSFEGLLVFAQKQLSLGEKVYAVYEAGPLGYVLYRRLKALGIEAHVSAPEPLERGTPKRKTDKFDARKLCGRLYSYLGGDRHAMRIVRVPTPEQEQLRAQSRQYDQLMASRKAIAAQGRSLLLSQGYRIRGNWWRPRAYGALKGLIPAWIQEMLETWRYDLKLLDSQIVELKKRLSQSLQGERPKGFGALSLVQLNREVRDWNRFSNPRKVGCYGGLVGSEYSSGPRQRLGPITKVGSPRVRAIVVEMVWRLLLFQPNYGPILKWREQLCGPNKGLKKQAVIAVARQLLVDIWRMATGRISAQQLGLIMVPGPSESKQIQATTVR